MSDTGSPDSRPVAALYVRVSTGKQRDNWSVADQRALARLGEDRGWSVEIYDEQGVSGETIEARPVMQRLLADVQAGRLVAIICVDWSRLSRDEDNIDGLWIKKACKDAGTLILTPGRVYDFATDSDGMVAQFEMMIAANYKSKLVKQTTRARYQQFAEHGYAGGDVRYGYKLVYDVPHKDGRPRARPAVDIEQAAIIRQIFDWYVNGAELDGEWRSLSHRSIARLLNERTSGFISTGRGRVRSDGGKYAAGELRPWQGQDVQRMLRAREYIGYWTFGEKRVSKYARDLGPQEVHKPETQIVSVDIWQRAQRVRSERAASQSRRSACSTYALTGILKCPQCDGTMSASIGQIRPGQTREDRTFYRCLRNWQSGAAGCSYTKRIREPDSRALVEALLLDAIHTRLHAHTRGLRVNSDLQSVEESVSAELANVGLQLSRLVDAVAEGVLTPAEVRPKKLDLLEKQERLAQRLTRLRQRSADAAQQDELMAAIGTLLPETLAAMPAAKFRQLARLVLAWVKIANGVVVGHELAPAFKEMLPLPDSTSGLSALTENAEVQPWWRSLVAVLAPA